MAEPTPNATDHESPLGELRTERTAHDAGTPANVQETDAIFRRIDETIAGLRRDQLDRGDLKLISKVLAELRRSFRKLKPYRCERKVTIFGSARTPPGSPRYEHAVAFGRLMASIGYMVVTGAGPGIMEAGHLGATRERSIGLNIELPFEQSANHVIDGDPKLVGMRYFFTRKLFLIKESDALVSYPGGFGTLDEAFEALTLMQTGKANIVPMVLMDAPGQHYWQDWQEYVETHLHRQGMISSQDFSLYRITHSITEARDEITHFYRVYDSVRYVGDTLVMRLRKPLPPAVLEQINLEFGDILTRGGFEQGPALPQEIGDEHLAHLPRLIFHFNRRSHGRLRQLIDFINQTV